MCLKNKVAVITGAGGGIGRELSIALAKNGAKVILLGGRNIIELDKTADIIKEYGGICKVIGGDLTDLQILNKAFSQAVLGEEKIDILINNAGIAHNTPIEQVSSDQFDRIMAINVKVPYFLTQKALPFIKKSTEGSIINIASVVAHAGYANQSVYTASKHALLGFTKSLALELHSQGIRVHAISPGGVYTDMIKISRPDLSSEGMIMPQDIVDIVMFILSHRNSNAVIDEIMVHRVGKQPFLV